MWWLIQTALAAPTLSSAFDAHADAHPAGEIGVCGPVSDAAPATWVASMNVMELTRLATNSDPRFSAGDFATWAQEEGGLRVDLPAKIDASMFYVGKFDASYFGLATSPIGPLKVTGARPDPTWRDEAFAGGLRVAVGALTGAGVPRALPTGVAAGRAAGCLTRTAAGPWFGYYADPKGGRELWRLVPEDAPAHGLGEPPRFTPTPEAFEAFAVPVLTGADRQDRLERWFDDPRWGHHFRTTNDAMGAVQDVWSWLGAPDATVVVAAMVGETKWVLVRPTPGAPLPAGLEAPGAVVLLHDGWSTDWYARALPEGWIAASPDASGLERAKVGGRPWWSATEAKAVFVAPKAFAGEPGFSGPTGRMEARPDHWVSFLNGVHPTTR